MDHNTIECVRVIDTQTLRLVNEYTTSSPSKYEKIDSDVPDYVPAASMALSCSTTAAFVLTAVVATLLTISRSSLQNYGAFATLSPLLTSIPARIVFLLTLLSFKKWFLLQKPLPALLLNDLSSSLSMVKQGGSVVYLGKYVRNKGFSTSMEMVIFEDRSSIVANIKNVTPTRVFNATGVTGRPNVDWCESHKNKTIRTNVSGTLTLADICRDQGILVMNFATGCIFYIIQMEKLHTRRTSPSDTFPTKQQRVGYIQVEERVP